MAWVKKTASAAPVNATEPPAEKSDYADAAEEMARFEERDEVPRDLSEWPTGKASHLTYGNEGDEAYGEGSTAKLGPGGLEHHEDGSVSIDGKLVDDPSVYKGEPITGGITAQITEQLGRNRESREQENGEGG